MSSSKEGPDNKKITQRKPDAVKPTTTPHQQPEMGLEAQTIDPSQLETMPANARPGYEQDILRKQSQFGNQAVMQRLMRHPAASGAKKPPAPILFPTVQREEDLDDEEVEEATPALQRQGLSGAAGSPPDEDDDLTIQAKMQVNEPNDEYEQEADAVASQVLRMGDDEEAINRQPLIQRQVQRSGASTPEVTPEIEQGVNSLQSGGSPLPDGERQFFESRMGADFSQVRIHDGSQASELSDNLEARAFTVGNSIAFNEGEYRPGSASGRELLAHELTHVVQQGAAAQVQRQEDDTAIDIPQPKPNEPTTEPVPTFEIESMPTVAADVTPQIDVSLAPELTSTPPETEEVLEPEPTPETETTAPTTQPEVNVPTNQLTSSITNITNLLQPIDQQWLSADKPLAPTQGEKKDAAEQPITPVNEGEVQAGKTTVSETGLEATSMPEEEAITVKSLPQAVDMLNALGVGAQGIYGGGGLPSAGGSAGSPELSQWKDSMQQSATTELAEKETPPVQEASSQFAEDTRAQQKTGKDGTKPGGSMEQATANAGQSPKADSPPPPPEVDPVPEATVVLNEASSKKLDNQTMPSLTASPLGTLPSTGQPNLADKAEKEKATSPEATGAETQSPQVDEINQALDQEAKEGSGTAKVPGITLEDKGIPEFAPTPEMQMEIMNALTSMMADLPSQAENIINQALEQAYPNSILLEHEDKVGKDALVQEEVPILQAELEQVAESAGIAKEELQAMAEAAKVDSKEEGDTALDDLQTTAETQSEEVHKTGEEKVQEVGDASAGVQENIEQKQEAADKPADISNIETKRDQLLTKIEDDAAKADAAYRRAGEERKQMLTDAGEVQQNAYERTVDGDIVKVASMYQEEAELTGKKDEIYQWGTTRKSAVDTAVSTFKTEADNNVARLQEELNTGAREAHRRVHEWAVQKIGNEETYWETFKEEVDSWSISADAKNKAWEEEQIRMNRDAMLSDLQMMAEYEKLQASRVQEDINNFLFGLSQSEQDMLNNYWGLGGNSIVGVMIGLINRLGQAHAPKYIATLKEKTLASNEYEFLNDVGIAQGSFNAKQITDNINKATGGWGTEEKDLFSALEGLTPEQMKAVRLLFKNEGSGNLEDVLKDELSGKDLERAQAALKGDKTTTDVLALNQAMHGLGFGTDEDAIMETLRGKSPEEIEAIKKLYKEKYGEDLMADFEQDMSGHDLERAEALLAGDVETADAIAVDQSMNGGIFGFGTDEQDIEDVYANIEKEVQEKADQEGMTTEEMEAEIRRRNQLVEDSYNKKYAEEEGGQTLQDAFNSELGGADLDLVNALDDYDRSAADAARLKQATKYENLAPGLTIVTMGPAGFAIDLMTGGKAQSMNKEWLVDDDAIEEVLRSQNSRAAEDEYRDLAAKGQRERDDLRFQSLQEGWNADEKEQKFKQLEETQKLESEAVNEKIQKRAKTNMDKLDKAYSKQYGESITDVINSGSSGIGQEKLTKLFDQGYLDPGQEIYYATQGLGTDEEKIKEIFKGIESPEELEELKELYAKANPNVDDESKGNEMFEMLESDLGSGRDIQDVNDIFYIYNEEIDPNLSPEERTKELLERKVQLLERRQIREYTGGSGSFGRMFSGNEQKMLDYNVKQAKENFEEYDQILEDYKSLPKPISEAEQEKYEKMLDRQERYANQWVKNGDIALQAHRDKIDQVADIGSTVVKVGVTIAGTAATILTAGTASPLAAAGIAAMWAGAGAAAGMGMKYAAKGGDNYGWDSQEFMTDVSLAAVDIAAAAATGGMSKMGGIDPSMLQKLGMNAVDSLLPAFASMVADDNLWESTNTFELLAGGMAKELAMLPIGLGVDVAMGDLDETLLNGPLAKLYGGGSASRVLAKSLAGGGNDFFKGVPNNLARLMMSEEMWRDGDPINFMLESLGKDGLQAFIKGSVEGGAKGVRDNRLSKMSGEEIAKFWGYPELEEGYEWVRNGTDAYPRRKKGYGEAGANIPPIIFDPKTKELKVIIGEQKVDPAKTQTTGKSKEINDNLKTPGGNNKKSQNSEEGKKNKTSEQDKKSKKEAVEASLKKNRSLKDFEKEYGHAYFTYTDKQGNTIVKRRHGMVDENWPKVTVDDKGNVSIDDGSNRISKPGKLRKKLLEKAGSKNMDAYEAHHLISDAVVRDHPLAILAREKGKPPYDLDDTSNGILLPSKKGVDPNLPVHSGSHPQWNNFVTEKLNNIQSSLVQEFGSIDKVPRDILTESLKELEIELQNDVLKLKDLK